MKIRIGFVSNSSSSSYICMTSKENHEKVLATFTEADRDAFEVFAKAALTEQVFLGVPIVVANYTSGEWFYETLRENVKEYVEKHPDRADDPMEDVYAVIELWKTGIRKDKDNTFMHREDF